jgi:hypothetical protein
VFGLVDWLAIPAGTRAKRIGALHGIGNVVVVVLFAVSWLLRRGQDDNAPSGLALWLGIIAVLLALWTAWAGGELVERLGVGVDPRRQLGRAQLAVRPRHPPGGHSGPSSPNQVPKQGRIPGGVRNVTSHQQPQPRRCRPPSA